MGFAAYFGRRRIAQIDDVVEILSRRYIEDVDVQVQCEGIFRMDKTKTKILRF